jgi:serine protease AprX
MQRVASVIHLDAARRLGLTGKGVGVAILDTGIGFHPDLTTSGSGLCAFVDTIHHRQEFYDDNGHGTHISGIIAGNGSASHGVYEGIAPDCHFVMIKVLNHRGEGNTEHVLAGIQWLLHHHAQYHIRIVNISVGSSRGKHFGENSPLVQGVNRLWSARLVVLTAAGNHGPSPQSIGAPGNSRKIITVGASDVMLGGVGRDYSGRGPTENCIKKPDIVAPGSNIVSCQPLPQTSPLLYGNHFSAIPQDHAYHSRSGTSMSTPVVSGCIALLLQQRPAMTNRDVKMHIKKTAYDLGYDHSRQGWGLIRLDRLL